MRLLLIVLFGLFQGAISVVSPLYPPNAAGGGMVVAVVKVADRRVKSINILSGEEPFVSSSRSALAQWSIPGEAEESHLVIVYFRPPQLFNTGSARQEVSLPGVPLSCAYPKYVFQPLYPVNASGQGSVILRIEVSPEGNVTDTRVIKSMGIFTDVSKQALAKWQFVPAHDTQGRKIASHAFVVILFRPPIIKNK